MKAKLLKLGIALDKQDIPLQVYGLCDYCSPLVVKKSLVPKPSSSPSWTTRVMTTMQRWVNK